MLTWCDMPSSLRDPLRSDPLRTSELSRPDPAKAGLRDDRARPASDRTGPTFNALIKTAVIQHYGSVKAAAISLGDVDPSLMQREFDDGKFKRLETAERAAKACIARALYEEYADDDPQARIRRALRDARQAIECVAELLDRDA